MGYFLQAFICKQSDTNIFIENFDKAKKVVIGQGLSLIPMTEELFDQINNFAVSNAEAAVIWRSCSAAITKQGI